MRRYTSFRGEKEEAEFWDTHDSTDFQSELEEDRETVFERRSPGMIYCLGCSYCLEGLTEHRCPECGRGFDREDSATFTRDPKHLQVRRVRRLLSFVMIGLVLLFSVLIFFVIAASRIFTFGWF